MSRFESFLPMLNLLRYMFWTHVADLFEERKITSVSDLVNEKPQKQIAEEFRCGIAGALGVPPEEIREDIVNEMITDLIDISKLEQGPEVAPSIDMIWKLGRKLGKTYKSAVLSHKQLERMK